MPAKWPFIGAPMRKLFWTNTFKNYPTESAHFYRKWRHRLLPIGGKSPKYIDIKLFSTRNSRFLDNRPTDDFKLVGRLIFLLLTFFHPASLFIYERLLQQQQLCKWCAQFSTLVVEWSGWLTSTWAERFIPRSIVGNWISDAFVRFPTSHIWKLVTGVTIERERRLERPRCSRCAVQCGVGRSTGNAWAARDHWGT